METSSVQDSLDGGPRHLRPYLVNRFNQGLGCGPGLLLTSRQIFLASLGDTLRFLPRPLRFLTVKVEPLVLVDYALEGCHRDIILF